ncbi:placenta growth factor-like [Anoplophora glabripennis]|uniref:placenta growth factor-like n=1 Tax=Anoplophora glabripennis TaxID=217634 RepID=UPI000874D957|nr:placenta growth factor-like [Anoplophora glabripennis]
MHYIRVALLLSLSVAVRADLLLAYREHEALVKDYPCRDPQPRVVELEEVIGEDVLKEETNGCIEKISPTVTMLHRCYSAGCCQNPYQKCMPVDTDDVTLTFLITGDTIKYFEVTAVNHTRCGCA